VEYAAHGLLVADPVALGLLVAALPAPFFGRRRQAAPWRVLVGDACCGEGRAWYTRGCLYLFFFSLEVGTMPWIVSSEFFPLPYASNRWW
jgi:hypothetical protein